VFRLGQMDQCTKVGGPITKQMGKEDLSMQMVISMMAFGKMIRLMDLEFIPIWMELDMKVIGKRINNMEKVLKLGLMVLHTEATTLKEKSMVTDNSHGQMAALIQGHLLKITLKDKESMSGVMEDAMKENGKITKWKVMECSLGLMEEDTKENTLMIKKKEMVFSIGLMVENMKDNGSTVNNTVKEYILLLVVKLKEENGTKESGSGG
jgi:hypothetical protein